jgi:hypothetical protein
VPVVRGNSPCKANAKKRRPGKTPSLLQKKSPATSYSPTADCRSTIAAEALHFRVRNGNGCYRLAMVTGKKDCNYTDRARDIHREGEKSQTSRQISTGKLSRSRDVHRQPIKVVVFDLPLVRLAAKGKSSLGGGLALRCFQRLSVPYVATQLCPRIGQLEHQRYVIPGPLVLGNVLLQISCAHSG